MLGRITPQLYEWSKGQLDTLDQWSQRIISSETWNTGCGDPSISGDVKCGSSMGEILKASNDVVESLLTMGIPIPPGVVRSMVDGVDAILQSYCESIVAPLQGVDEIFPPQPPLTRYKKDVVDTAHEIDHSVPKQPTPEKSPGSNSLKNITASEDVFNDHFPHFPVYPGALLIETMAQVGGLLVEKTVTERDNRRVLPVLSIVKSAKFRDATLPGDTLIIEISLENCTEDASMVHAVVFCDGQERANADLFFTLMELKDLLCVEELREIDAVKNTIDRVSAYRNRRRSEL